MADAAIPVIHGYGAISEALRESLQQAFPNRAYRVLETEEELRRCIAEIEVLVAMRPPRGVWAAAKRLRLIQMTGAGVDSLLPAPDLPERVRIANARGIHTGQMSEYALAMMLAFARRIPRALEQQRDRRWQIFGARRLEGKTLGVLGLGAIGEELARKASLLGMRVIGTRRSPRPSPHASLVLPSSETARVVRESDFLVIVLPFTKETRGLLNAELLASMKPHAVLVNMARGGIVDEAALARLLHAGRIEGAALDVFEEEPLPATSPLWGTPRTILTPHHAGIASDYMERVAEIFVENITRLACGRPLRNAVDRQRGY
jgi:phosphoglycerate dehydrogenase-like enzyme